MSFADATLRMVLLGDDVSASAALRRVGANASATEKRLALMSASMGKLGKSMTHAFTLPAVAIAGASVKMATDFSSAMTRIQTQAGGSARDVKKLSTQVLALSSKGIQQGPVELANALYHLKSVGLDNADAMRALVQSSHLAAVGNADLEQTTNAVAGAWRTGIRGATDFKQAVSTLNAIIGAGNMTMSDLNDALSTGFLPAGKTFGLTLHDIGAALAVFTDEGVPASVAATRLRMSFSLLGAPSDKAAKLLDSVGINTDKLAHKLRNGGLVSAIGYIKQGLQDFNKVDQAQIISHAFGGGRSGAAIMSLINNFSVLQQKEKQVTAGMSRFGADVAKQAETPQAQFHRLIATLETLGVEIGDKLLPVVIHGADDLQRFITWFERLPSPVRKAAGELAVFTAAAGPALIIAGKLAGAVAKIASLGSLGRSVGKLGGGLAGGRGVVPVYVTNEGFGGGAGGLARDAEKVGGGAAAVTPTAIVTAAAGALTALGITAGTVYALIQESKSGPGAQAGGMSSAQWKAFNSDRMRATTGIAHGTAELKAMGTALDAVKAHAAGASRSLDQIGPHAAQTSKQAAGAVQRFASQMDPVHVKAEAASRSIDMIGPHAEQMSSRATPAIRALNDQLAGVGKAKPNLAPFQSSLRGQLDQAGGIARAGGAQIGNELGAGLSSAVAGWSGSIARQSADLVSNAIQAARHAAQAHSPSRKMIALGHDLIDGLMVGIKDRWQPLKAAMTKIQADVQNAIGRLKGDVQARNQFAAGFQSFASSAFGMPLSQDANGNDIAPTYGSIFAFAQQQRNQARMVKADVARLVKMGLSPALLKQLQAQGAAGIPEIQALATANKAQIRRLDLLNSGTSSDLHSAGMTAANRLYGSRIAQDQRDRAELQRILKDLKHALDHFGEHAEVRVRGEDLVIALKARNHRKGVKSAGV